MPKHKRHKNQDNGKPANLPMSFFACPNSDCADFNHFDADNLSIAEWMGKDKAIRRLHCKTCGARFSDRQGSLMQYTKLPQRAQFLRNRKLAWPLRAMSPEKCGGRGQTSHGPVDTGNGTPSCDTLTHS